MKKQLIYSTDSYWYNKFDEEDGLPVYEEYGDKYDDWMATEDYEAVVNQLDELKFEKYPRREKKVKIYPDLGLWDGHHKCYTEEEDDFKTAISRCIRDMDDFEIYQAGDWTIYIDAHHHDGTNHFKLTCYL